MKKTFFLTNIFILMVSLLNSSIVNASFSPKATGGAYGSYTYDTYTTPVKSPDGYIPLFESAKTGKTALNKPKDLYAAPDGKIYVADTGNDRILVLDKDLNFVREITSFNNDNMNDPLSSPEGIFVSANGWIYIADTGKKRIVCMDQDLNVIREIKEPVSELIPKDLEYKPIRLVADRAGRVYVLAYGNFMGLLKFDPKGNYDSYFGSNRVEMTAKLMIERFWRSILSRKQRETMVKFIPIEYSGIDIDDEGFIFTSVRVSDNSSNELKKLNPLGNNVLPPADYGDLDYVLKGGVRQDTSFIDIDVDEEGFMNGLDITRGRIFQYDQEGNLLYAFGTMGDQLGAFKEPIAIDSAGDRLYVLDATKKTITVFAETSYGTLLRGAIKKNEEGLYEEAGKLWDSVLKHNVNLEFAYAGKGKALQRAGNYAEAASNFKYGNDRKGFENAFTEVRREKLSVFIPYIGSGIIVLMVGLKIFSILKRRRNHRLRKAGRGGAAA